MVSVLAMLIWDRVEGIEHSWLEVFSGGIVAAAHSIIGKPDKSETVIKKAI